MISHKIIQYIFSILGVISLGFFYWQMFKGESKKSTDEQK